MRDIGDDSTLYETSLHDCPTDNVLDLTFEAPHDNGMVEVNYPFTFRSGNEGQDQGE